VEVEFCEAEPHRDGQFKPPSGRYAERVHRVLRCCQDTDQYQPVFALEKQIEPVGGDGRVSRR